MENLSSKSPPASHSLSEYEAWFGVGPNVTYNVYLDTNDSVLQVNPSQTFYMVREPAFVL